MSKIEVNEIAARTGTTITVDTGDALKVDTIKGTATAGSITVQGEGSATTNLQQGLAKQWVHTPSGTSISDSLNSSSVTDNSQGFYTIAITNDFSNATYAVPCAKLTGGSNRDCGIESGSMATGSYGLYSTAASATEDQTCFGVAHGDLA